jgi:hypothetical protein
MGALAIGQSSSCANPILDLYTQVAGVATNVAQLEFQIFDQTNPSAPVQIYPTTPGQRASVDVGANCPAGDRVATGHYVARWTVPPGTTPGTHRITWFIRLTLSSGEQVYSEEFEVLPEVEATSVDDAYAFVSQLRADGVTTTQASDSRLLQLIEEASRTIDDLTGLFFAPRSIVVDLDGLGTPSMFLDMPIISISEVRIDGEVIDLATLVIYNRHLTQRLTRPDDRRNPLVTRREGRVWPKGSQNVQLSGVFGFTDPTGAPLSQGRLPPAINLACRMLVVRELELLASPDRVASRRQNEIRSETTRDQSVTYGERRGATSRPQYGTTGDPEIDAILARYRPPLKMAMV